MTAPAPAHAERPTTIMQDAHVTMGGGLPSYCGDCVREVVMEQGKPVERWECRVTGEIVE